MEYRNTLINDRFDPTPYAERVNELLAKMTVAEKIGQLNLEFTETSTELSEYNPEVDEGSATELIQKIRSGAAGSLLMHGRHAVNVAQKIAMEESRLGIPLLIGEDIIHGHRTVFPIPLAEAATWEPALLEQAESVAAKEAFADGINWIYAPMLDLCRDPRWGRVAEGAGEDPLLGSLIAQAKVRGLQTINPETGVPYASACFKHFCGYGLSQGGRDYEECDISLRSLFADYMKPYMAAVDAGAMSVMSSFNVLNGVPISANRYFLTDVLRDRMGFKGPVVSDAIAIWELMVHRMCADREGAGRLSINAGVDIDMGANIYLEYGEKLYNEDKRFADAIDESVRRVLSLKFALGLFENPYRDDSCEKMFLTPESRELARKIACHCMVLLKNENNLLPLSKDQKFFVTGVLAENENHMVGTWAHYDAETNVYSIKKAFTEGGYNCDIFSAITLKGRESFKDKDYSNFEEALARASECDVIIYCCGEAAMFSGENRGSAKINLTNIQYEYLRELKKLGKPIVSVLLCGRALACVELVENSDALLLAWHAGTETGHAVCDCLFGDHNPSGRLPITFPRHVGQVPYYHAWLSSGRSRAGKMGRYLDVKNSPLFPFGYGLSYSTITYSNEHIENPSLAIGDELTVCCTLTNESERDAFEVVQTYFRDEVSSVATPERKLCAFAKVFVPAGESVDVTIKIPTERFSLTTQELEDVVEPGDFTLFIGHDSTCDKEIPFKVV